MTDRIYIKRGTTEPIYITVNIGDENDSDDQENITGMTVSFWMKRYITDADSDAIVKLTSSTSNILIDPEFGLVKIQINPSDTVNLPAWYQDYYFRLEIVDGAGNLVRVGEGTIGVTP